MYYGLSEPKVFNFEEKICHNVIKVYKEFNDKFLVKNNREKLKGDFIYVENIKEYGVNKCFLHSVSIRDNEKYGIYPCTNDITYTLCNTKCSSDSKSNIRCVVNLKQNRAICYYRLARIHWVPEIIAKANEDDVNIKMWSKTFKDKTTGRMRIKKRFVWYKCGLANYVIIFEEKYKDRRLNFLKYITSYPVFGKQTEKGFERDFRDYMLSKKGNK
ncbi:MAG: hypothetical protein IJ094_11595 [Bacilli bacterium]|nr:hypothetical protein [Bacilli bacterium]